MVHEQAAPVVKPLAIPTQVVSPSDINRLLRELEAVDDFLHQATIRAAGESLKLPATSRLLEEFSSLNQLNWLQTADRQRAKQFITELKARAPVVHISFASDPSAATIGKILAWFRTNISPEVLLRIGLEPSIAAGCTVRTPNKFFDLSLRQRFIDQRELLRRALASDGETGI